MSGVRRRKNTTAATEPGMAEVEELLRVAQDDLLLKLSLDTHTTASSLDPTLSSFSSSSLDPDLSRRFDALRSHPAPAAANREPPVARSDRRGGGGGAASAASSAAGGETRGGINEDEAEMSRILGDDLAVRFSALKGSSSSHLPASNVARRPYRVPEEVDDDDESDESDDGGDGVVSKKEVEKLMRWAADAARLDPDPSSSDDEEGLGKEGEKSEREEEEDVVGARADEKKKKKKEEEAEGKTPPTRRKWFF